MTSNRFAKLPLFLYYLWALMTVMAWAGCAKDYSCENCRTVPVTPPPPPPPTVPPADANALFTLVPSGVNCSDAVVSGKYMEQTALPPDATVSVTVNVTKTGAWSYSTIDFNGISFTGAGNFTTTGNQVIVLQAVGQPENYGSFDYPLDIGGADCKVWVTVEEKPMDTEGQYKATIGGVPYHQWINSYNNYLADSHRDGTNEVVLTGGVEYQLPVIPPGKTEFYMSKGKMRNYTTATPADFKAFFAPGNYSYAPDNYASGDGIQLRWRDPSGEFWSTRNGAVDQVGSTFKIVHLKDLTDIFTNYYVVVIQVEYNCKLYHETTGEMKSMNGTAGLVFKMR